MRKDRLVTVHTSALEMFSKKINMSTCSSVEIVGLPKKKMMIMMKKMKKKMTQNREIAYKGIFMKKKMKIKMTRNHEIAYEGIFVQSIGGAYDTFRHMDS